MLYHDNTIQMNGSLCRYHSYIHIFLPTHCELHFPLWTCYEVSSLICWLKKSSRWRRDIQPILLSTGIHNCFDKFTQKPHPNKKPKQTKTGKKAHGQCFEPPNTKSKWNAWLAFVLSVRLLKQCRNSINRKKPYFPFRLDQQWPTMNVIPLTSLRSQSVSKQWSSYILNCWSRKEKDPYTH